MLTGEASFGFYKLILFPITSVPHLENMIITSLENVCQYRKQYVIVVNGLKNL